MLSILLCCNGHSQHSLNAIQRSRYAAPRLYSILLPELRCDTPKYHSVHPFSANGTLCSTYRYLLFLFIAFEFQYYTTFSFVMQTPIFPISNIFPLYIFSYLICSLNFTKFEKYITCSAAWVWHLNYSVSKHRHLIFSDSKSLTMKKNGNVWGGHIGHVVCATREYCH